MSQSGILSGMAVTAGMAVPIKDVSVVITGTGDTPQLLAYRETDKSGLIPDIVIETPDLEISQSPDKGKGFASCNMIFFHPGYYKVQINDIQVFPDNKSMQVAEMPPLPENTPDDKRVMTYDISAQEL